jgi:uncharacterized repeat protein (TIGR03803 family)
MAQFSNCLLVLAALGRSRFYTTLADVRTEPSLAIALSSTETVLHAFDGQDVFPRGKDELSVSPFAGLVFDKAGRNLYGLTTYGGDYSCGSGCGTVFEVAHLKTGEWRESTTYSFEGGTDGQNPGSGSLVWDTGGDLYGTTGAGGGASDCGTVFEITP